MDNYINRNKRGLFLQYCVVQAFYWAGLCYIGSYATVYLQSHGYTNAQLGLVVALGNIGGFFLAPCVASVIDKSKRISVFQCLLVLLVIEGAMDFVLSFFNCNALVVGILFCIADIIAVAVNPLNTDMCFALDSSGKYVNYGTARAFGSLTYAGMSVLLGILCANISPDILPISGLIMVILQLIALVVIILLKNKNIDVNAELSNTQDASDEALSLPEFLTHNRRFLLFCLGLCFLNFSSCLLSCFQINIVENLGGNSANMGLLTGLTALAEVPTMIFYTRITKNIKCSNAIKIASVMYVVKAIFYLVAPTVQVLYFSCIIQAFSYAILIPAMVDYTNIVVKYSDIAKGQSVCAALYTLGNVFSSQFGGLLLDRTSVEITMCVGVAVCILGAAICIISVSGKVQPAN